MSDNGCCQMLSSISIHTNNVVFSSRKCSFRDSVSTSFLFKYSDCIVFFLLFLSVVYYNGIKILQVCNISKIFQIWNIFIGFLIIYSITQTFVIIMKNGQKSVPPTCIYGPKNTPKVVGQSALKWCPFIRCLLFIFSRPRNRPLLRPLSSTPEVP